MARAFDITAGSEVRLDAKGQGDAVFTVSNVSGRRVRGRAKAVPKDPATAGWLSISGDAERDFAANCTQLFTTKVVVPADARPGSHTFRLDIVSVDNPDEETAQGPSVSFSVAEAPPPPPKSYATWLILAVVLVVILGGAAMWLVRPRPTLTPPPPVVAASFAGDWSTNFATLVLKQDGEKVNGVYRIYGREAPVSVAGTVHDRTLSGSLGDPASKTAFSVTLDPGNDSFRGTWGAQKPWCGARGYPVPLPPDCGFSGRWTYKSFNSTLTMDLVQAADTVTGTWQDAVDQGDRTDQQKLTVSDLSGQMRGSVLEGELKAALAGGPPLKQHFRWTVLNDEFQQFQGIEFAMKAETDDRLQVLFAADNCGSRQGTPLPAPCRELSGLVIDSFKIEASTGTDHWDALDNAPTRSVVLGRGPFRAIISVTANTAEHVQVVGLGVRDVDQKSHWLRISKGFSTSVVPSAAIGVQQRLADGPATLLPMLTEYSDDTVHLQVERSGLGQFSLSFSADGERWTTMYRDLSFPMSQDLELFAVAYSNYNGTPLVADFSALRVTPISGRGGPPRGRGEVAPPLGRGRSRATPQ